AHMFPLSEPERTGVGLRHTTDHVQGHQLAAPQTLSNAAPDLSGRGQGLPAPPQTLTVAPDLGLQQAPVTGFHGHPALHQSLTTTVAPDFGVHALTTTEFQGHPALETTLNAAPDFGLPVPAAPIVDAAAGNYQPSSAMLDVEYHQPMAIDNNDIQQPSHQMLPPEMHRRHAYGGGGFAEPTTMLCDGGADEASLVERNMQMLLADGGVIPHPHRPSPSLYEQLVNNGQAELAAVVRNLERGESSGGAAALINDVYPVKEDVWFRPIVRGQLDCSRCHSVREVVRQDERWRMHFTVHASEPGMVFQHAIVDRMSIGADGHFHTDQLLHHDLRRRNHVWVHNFIARSVEMMKRNSGQMHSSYDSAAAAEYTTTNAVVTPAPPPASHHHHAHMGLEVNMLNSILSAAPAATTVAQPPGITPQEQQQTTVAEAAAPEAVTQQEQAENTDAPRVAEAAIPVPAVTAPQEQEATDAPAEGAERAAAPRSAVISRKQDGSKDAGAVFAAFKWEGFQPEILESSLVEPYDPESGANVLLYPSLVEQLRQTELERKESKSLSKMPAAAAQEDTTSTYLQMSGEASANEPKLGSSSAFRRLCQKDATYRLYSRR
ncbi:hypothetical protein ACJX0J_034492, partial [Zea mays]